MPPTPGITFHFPDNNRPIDSRDPRWYDNLPVQAPATDASSPLSAANHSETSGIRYGEYFSVLARFLARNDYRQLRRAVDKLAPARKIRDDWRIRIISEKHGALYHPARIAVDIDGTRLELVANFAFSDEGRRILPHEVENLLRLELEFELPFLPRVFGAGELELDDGRPVALFLGEWFPHHYEFHLARNPRTGKDGIHLWEPRRPAWFLDAEAVHSLFQQAAFILTCYYNPLTREQIFPWHHAAGDFIWNPETPSGEGSLRLITVRGYQSLAGRVSAPPDAHEIVNGLILFFLHMALGMRLDRRNGVGRLDWVTEEVLTPVLSGFLEGLEFKSTRYGLPAGFPQKLCRHLARLDFQDLRPMYRELIDGLYPVGGDDHTQAAAGLERHIHDLAKVLANSAGKLNSPS